jgi:hypothetical protein
MATSRRLTVSAKWLEMAATKLEMEADASLTTWIVLGQAHRYCEDMGKARAMRQAIGIKDIAARRHFLRAIGIEA